MHILAINKVSVITCNTCKKKKNLEEYSNKQLRKAADSYHNREFSLHHCNSGERY